VRQDEFAQHEEEARDLIEVLGKLSHDVQASPGFTARVLAQADELRVPRRGWLRWMTEGLMWPTSTPARVAFAALGLLLCIGAVSQYATWINAYLMGVPSGAVREARLQEQLWEKNFLCATQLDRSSNNYAATTGDNVTVVAWACPSGDVLVTLESTTEETLQRSVWIPLNSTQKAASFLENLVPEAMAAPLLQVAKKQADPIIAVLCQKRLPGKLVKRRIRRANGRCIDEVIDTRSGRVIKRQKAPCTRDC
jgi:hypothetical protein